MSDGNRERDGVKEGALLGSSVADGLTVGTMDGAALGCNEIDGTIDWDGGSEGTSLGTTVSDGSSDCDGTNDGVTLGYSEIDGTTDWDGASEGTSVEGTDDGAALGCSEIDGTVDWDGASEGTSVGTTVSDGTSDFDGTADGAALGPNENDGAIDWDGASGSLQSQELVCPKFNSPFVATWTVCQTKLDRTHPTPPSCKDRPTSPSIISETPISTDSIPLAGPCLAMNCPSYEINSTTTPLRPSTNAIPSPPDEWRSPAMSK